MPDAGEHFDYVRLMGSERLSLVFLHVLMKTLMIVTAKMI